jgi:hypothetical protein
LKIAGPNVPQTLPGENRAGEKTGYGYSIEKS